MLVTVSLLGVNIYGFYHLKQDFDLTMYIPSDSYAHKFSKAQDKYFPNRGVDVNVYCGQLEQNRCYFQKDCRSIHLFQMLGKEFLDFILIIL